MRALYVALLCSMACTPGPGPADSGAGGGAGGGGTAGGGGAGGAANGDLSFRVSGLPHGGIDAGYTDGGIWVHVKLKSDAGTEAFTTGIISELGLAQANLPGVLTAGRVYRIDWYEDQFPSPPFGPDGQFQSPAADNVGCQEPAGRIAITGSTTAVTVNDAWDGGCIDVSPF
jgi:hypothetical protein